MAPQLSARQKLDEMRSQLAGWRCIVRPKDAGQRQKLPNENGN
jgi:hypothetical protein